jgi:type I restriction enzyme, S subunit
MSELKNIPDGWVEITLGEVINISSGKSRPKNIGHYPVYGGNGILDYADKYNYENETIIIGRVGAYCGCVYYENNKFWLSDNALGIKSNTKSNIKFLYYFLIYQNLNKKSIGGAQPLLTQGILNQIEIVIPKDTIEQKSIAAILTAFDNKIELLQAQNKTLEETAQTIFAEWFGKYSVDDELPDGWRVGKLGEVTKTYGGTTPSTTNPDFWDGDIYWTSPKDLSNSKGIFLLNTDKKITKEGLKKISSGLLPKRTLILSSRAPIGYLALTNIELAINQGYIAIVPEQYFSNNFMYLWLTENMKLVENASNGSTFMEISKSSFRNIDCVIPNKEILEKFDNFINPTFEKVLSNLIQIQTLTKTRDELLPRLMSGEVRVKGN